MEGKRGYYEAAKNEDLFGLPVTILAGNILFNGLHWHDHLEMIFCRKGVTHVRMEGTEYILKEGDFLMIGGRKSHEIFGSSADGLQIICSIDSDALEDLKDSVIFCSTLGPEIVSEKLAEQIRWIVGEMAYLCHCTEDTDPDVLPDRNPGAFSTLNPAVSLTLNPAASSTLNPAAFSTLNPAAEGAYEEGERNRSQEEAREWILKHHPLHLEKNRLMYQSYQYHLLALLSACKRPGSQQELKRREAKQQALVIQSIVYIHSHLGETLNAAVLADKMNVSEPTIYRLFREQIGMPLGEYISAVRIEAVCRYLQIGNENVTNIAYACGFTGLSNFYRVFQNRMGITPNKYRKQHQLQKNAMLMPQTDIMRLNRFINFYETGYKAEDLRFS